MRAPNSLYVVLRAQQDPVRAQPWFGFVKRILVIDQERFVSHRQL